METPDQDVDQLFHSGPGRRIAALVIDGALLAAGYVVYMAVILFATLPFVAGRAADADVGNLVLYQTLGAVAGGVLVLFTLSREAWSGVSIGKSALGLQIRDLAGLPLPRRMLARRWLLKAIPPAVFMLVATPIGFVLDRLPWRVTIPTVLVILLEAVFLSVLVLGMVTSSDPLYDRVLRTRVWSVKRRSGHGFSVVTPTTDGR